MPASRKKLVRREITRVVTPGTAMDAHLVRSHENNYLAAVARAGARVGHGARGYLDGRISRHRNGCRGSRRRAGTIWARAKCLFPRRSAAAHAAKSGGPRFVRTELEDWIFTLRLRGPHAARPLQAAVARWLRPGRTGRAAICAAGAILHYLRDTQRAALDHLDRPSYYDRAESHGAGRGHGAQSGTGGAVFAGEGARRCIGVLDQTLTGMGGRLLRQRLLRPSLRSRGDRSSGWMRWANLLQQTILRAELRKQLGGILDLERLLAKVTLGTRGSARPAGAGPVAREDSRR